MSARQLKASSNGAATSSSAIRPNLRALLANWPVNIRTSRSSTLQTTSSARRPCRISSLFYGRIYESQYLCGVVAGATSKKANIGFLAARPSTITDWEINGYTLGVLKANPKAAVHVVFTGNSSATHERTAATALIDRGADVIGQGVDGLTPQLVAQERGVLATGYAVDLHKASPKSAICSSIWVWDRYLAQEFEKIAAGHWQAEPSRLLLGITGGGTDIACCSTAIGRQTMIKLLAERADITIDRQQVFARPIIDNQNRQRVPKGAVLRDTELWKMDWYVKGVVIDK